MSIAIDSSAKFVLTRGLLGQGNEIPSANIHPPITDREKINSVLEAHNKAMKDSLHQAVEARDKAVYEALENVEQEYKYEATWPLDHQKRASSRRRVRF